MSYFGGSSDTNTDTALPSFTREELIYMRRDNPNEYKQRLPEILKAYREGRVEFSYSCGTCSFYLRYIKICNCELSTFCWTVQNSESICCKNWNSVKIPKIPKPKSRLLMVI